MTDDTRHTSTLREAAHMLLRPGGGQQALPRQAYLPQDSNRTPGGQ